VNPKLWIFVVALAAVAVVPALIRAQAGPAKPAAAAVFAGLRPGQTVVVKDFGDSYQITMAGSATPPGYEIVEIGADYIAIKDIANLGLTRIPIYSVKSVVTMNIAFGDQQ
jgi:hypothetical protein